LFTALSIRVDSLRLAPRTAEAIDQLFRRLQVVFGIAHKKPVRAFMLRFASESPGQM